MSSFFAQAREEAGVDLFAMFSIMLFVGLSTRSPVRFVEQGVFFWNNFFVTGQRTFIFTSPVVSHRLFQAILVLIFTFEHARSLKSLSYDRA